MSDLNVNPDEIEESGFPVVTPGIYEAILEGIDFATERDDPSTRRTDKNGDEYLSADFKLVGGEFEGTKIFVNYLHPTKKAVRNNGFKDLCKAVGKFGPVATTEELVGLPLRLEVENEMYNEVPKNVIKAFHR